MEMSLRKLKGKTIFINFVAFYFIAYGGIGALTPLLPVYLKQSIGLTGTQIGLIMSITPVITIFTQPLWGMLSDYTQRPRMILTATIMFAAGIGVSYSFIDSFIGIVIIATVLAVVQSAIIPISDSMTLTYVQSTNLDYGSIRLWGALGFALSVLLIGKLADTLSLSIIFIVFSLAMIGAGHFAWRLPDGNTEVARVNLLAGMQTLIKMPRFLLMIVSTFLVIGPMLANNSYFGIFITEIGGTLTGVGIAFLIGAGSEAPFMKFVGRLIKAVGVLEIILFSSVIAIIRWFFYFLEPSLVLVYATVIAQGLSFGLFLPAALQYVRDISPKEIKATSVSIFSAIGNGLGAWFCIFIGGIILDAYSIKHVYFFYGLLTALGIILLIVMIAIDRKKRARRIY